MYKASVINDIIRLSCIKRESVETNTGTISDVDGPEEVNRPDKAKSKINIIMLDKTNMTSILVSY